MKYIIFIDIDGTLCRDDESISEKTKVILNKLEYEGHYIVLCTGRPRYYALQIRKEINSGNFIISSNGSEIYDISNKCCIDATFLNVDEFNYIYTYAQESEIRLIAVTENKEFVTREIKNKKQELLPKDNITLFLKENKIKQLMLLSEDNNIIKRAKKDILKSVKTIAILNEAVDKKWISIGKANISKGVAIQKISDYLGVNIKNTIAIGNDCNDVPMFQMAEISVSMGNALAEVKKHAKIVTCSNNEDGVWEFLNSFFYRSK